MSVKPGPRFPVEPLLRVTGCYDGPGYESRWGNRPTRFLSPDVALAVKLGFSTPTEFHRATNWPRVKREGLTWNNADEWAVALGFHPCDIWGELWWEASEKVEAA